MFIHTERDIDFVEKSLISNIKSDKFITFNPF
jgi:hypothetical protein